MFSDTAVNKMVQNISKLFLCFQHLCISPRNGITGSVDSSKSAGNLAGPLCFIVSIMRKSIR